MRKHHLYLLLALVLTLLTPLALAAQAQSAPAQLLGAQLIDQNDNVTSFVYHQGMVHILTRQGYYRWQPGQDMARPLPDAPVGQRSYSPDMPDGIDALLVYGDALVGLDAYKGVLHDVTITDTGFTIAPRMTLAWEHFMDGEPPYEYVTPPAFVNIIGDTLLVRLDNWDNKAVDLYAYDLKTGTMAEWPVTKLFDIVPYKDNQVLAVHFDQDKCDEKTLLPLPARLVAISLDDYSVTDIPHALEEKGRHGLNGNLPLYYDAAADTIFVRNGNELTSLKDVQQPAVTANLAMGDGHIRTMTPSILPYQDDLVLVAAQSNVYVCSTDAAKMAPTTALRTNMNMLDSRTISKALLQLDNIRLADAADQSYSQEALLGQLMAGQADVDLLQMDAGGFDIQQLMKKGYLADLSDSPVIADMVRDALPTLQHITQLDGRVYTIPLSYQPVFLEVNLDVFEQMGRDVPATIPELIDLARWWGEEGHNTVEEVVLFDMHSAKRLMKELAFESYKAGMFGQGQPLVFDMERFGKVMQDIDALNTEEWDLPSNYGSGDDDDECLGTPAITPYMGYSAQHASDGGNRTILLAFDNNTPAYTHAHTFVVGVAANSPHKDAAIRFLEAYVQSMDELLRATLSRSWDKPVMNPTYEYTLQQIQDSLTQLQTQLEKTENAAERRELEAGLALQQEGLKEFQATGQYLMTAEQLAAHRKLMEQTYVDDSFSRLANEALSRDGYMLHMYIDGALTLEQFIQQANDKIRLMTLEAQ